jgi:hypothetical protein
MRGAAYRVVDDTVTMRLVWRHRGARVQRHRYASGL